MTAAGTAQSKNVNLLELDLESGNLGPRDKDGEYAGTKDMDNQSLLKEQRSLIKSQDTHLD